jgi:ABC-type transporter Mla maintaining outer membrane lipid asymmetry ATPase subunit MlaF
MVGTPKEIQATQDPIVRQFITGVGDVTQEVQRGTATVH